MTRVLESRHPSQDELQTNIARARKLRAAAMVNAARAMGRKFRDLMAGTRRRGATVAQ